MLRMLDSRVHGNDGVGDGFSPPCRIGPRRQSVLGFFSGVAYLFGRLMQLLVGIEV